MTALLLAAAFACGAALPAMAEQATPETAAQPDPTEWADVILYEEQKRDD